MTDKDAERRARWNKKRTPEYYSWEKMWQRCADPKNNRYHRYGGRGITVCERWSSFANFLADMGLRPSKQHSLDRINNNGNYEPGNCRWATTKEQRRNSSRSRHCRVHGIVYESMVDAAKALGVTRYFIIKHLDTGAPGFENLTYGEQK